MGCIEMGLGKEQEKEYDYVVDDDYSGAVHTNLLHTRSEAAGALNAFKVATENEVQMKLREVMTDDREKDGYDGPRSSCVQ
jgi:hypothetical protein